MTFILKYKGMKTLDPEADKKCIPKAAKSHRSL